MSPVLQVDTESTGMDTPSTYPHSNGNSRGPHGQNGTPSPDPGTPLNHDGGMGGNNGIHVVDYNTLGVGSGAASTYSQLCNAGATTLPGSNNEGSLEVGSLDIVFEGHDAVTASLNDCDDLVNTASESRDRELLKDNNSCGF